MARNNKPLICRFYFHATKESKIKTFKELENSNWNSRKNPFKVIGGKFNQRKHKSVNDIVQFPWNERKILSKYFLLELDTTCVFEVKRKLH